MDERTHIAAMALQGLLAGVMPEALREGGDVLPNSVPSLTAAAVDFADALLAKPSKVPAPSGGPVAPEKGNENASDSRA